MYEMYDTNNEQDTIYTWSFNMLLVYSLMRKDFTCIFEQAQDFKWTFYHK